MPKFEFPEWIEVFAAGTWTDAGGNTMDWSLDDLKEIAAAYDPEKYLAPVVIGHPETDSPAYGWIESLKVEGEKLLAKPGQLIDEFKDWVGRGLYKKISISLFPDVTLRHVGFLGGTPPAVKGLKPVSFGEKKAGWTFEREISFAKECSHMNEDGTFIGGFDGCVEHMMSCEGHDEDSAQKICAYIGRKAGKIHSASSSPSPIAGEGGCEGEHKKGGNIMYEWLTKMKEAIGLAEKQMMPDPSIKFTEADIASRVKETEEKIRKETEATFAEAQKKIEAEKKEKEEAQNKLKEIEIKARKDQIHTFCESLAKDGKLIPAWQKMGIEEFIFNLDAGDSLKFAEGCEKSRSQWFMDFISELPKVVNFKEVTPKDGPGAGGTAGEKLGALTKKKMEDKKDLSYGVAFAEVQKENPELAREYLTEINPNKK